VGKTTHGDLRKLLKFHRTLKLYLLTVQHSSTANTPSPNNLQVYKISNFWKLIEMVSLGKGLSEMEIRNRTEMDRKELVEQGRQ